MPRFARRLLPAAFLASLALLAFARPASAQRVATKAARVQKNGVTTTRWTANGVRFEHRTYGAGKRKLGWERRATRDKNPDYATTKLSGKLWGSKIRGEEMTFGKQFAKDVTATSPTGQQRRTMTIGTRGGTVRTEINMQPENQVRKITTWRMGNTEVTATRDYRGQVGSTIDHIKPVGRPIHVERRAQRARP